MVPKRELEQHASAVIYGVMVVAGYMVVCPPVHELNKVKNDLHKTDYDRKGSEAHED